ncbi:MAG: UDP-N-acetylglucosamine 1-carboxyvinyltransferase [Propionibacteriaceae bacterium]|nr:UDP-N-acetylglucosamine 1-carboxyvinyltransferase [Propionibacteriaceae bacterium]
MREILPSAVGALIRDARRQRGMTQHELANRLNTSQSAIGRIEGGRQNLSLDMVNRIAAALEAPLLRPTGAAGTPGLRVTGPTKLKGAIEVRSSKNAAVALLCASLLNHGTTVLRNVAHIEEVNRIIEVLTSIGVAVTWLPNGKDLQLSRPEKLDLASLDQAAARQTRSIIMLLGPLLHDETAFDLPFAGGCELGIRTINPHKFALAKFGLDVRSRDNHYHVFVSPNSDAKRRITLIERGDTVTENVLMAAALDTGTTIVNNASANYMVQDLCFFLQLLGVEIDGIGSTRLTVKGVPRIEADVEFAVSEDPIEAMSLITAGIVTNSEITVRRSPIEFLEIELAILGEMGLDYDLSPSYRAENGQTKLLDVTIHPSQLRAAADKIHPLPFPGLNIDNLPFFAVIAASAIGKTTIHDWVYENRAIHLADLKKLGADIQLLDPHRLVVQGPTRWKADNVVCPKALRPAVCLLLATMAAAGESVIHDIYMINRGYEDLPRRLNALGATIESFDEITGAD